MSTKFISCREEAKDLNTPSIKQVAKDELARECDYKLEAANQRRFRELLKNDEAFYVPRVYEEFCNTRVLTTELVPGNFLLNLMLVFIRLTGLCVARCAFEKLRWLALYFFIFSFVFSPYFS